MNKTEVSAFFAHTTPHRAMDKVVANFETTVSDGEIVTVSIYGMSEIPTHLCPRSHSQNNPTCWLGLVVRHHYSLASGEYQ